MKRLINLILGILTLLYPVAVYFGLSYFEPKYLVLILVLLFGLKTLVTNQESMPLKHSLLIFAGITSFSLLVFLANSQSLLLFYPVLVSTLFLLLFSFSLLYPPSMIERFARATDPNLADAAIPYTRNVTKAWCVFFIVNGGIALYTALNGDLKLWSLYNGFISYCFLGAFFTVELIARHFYKKKHHEL